MGTLPAAGATPASLMAYGLAKTFSKDPDSFGKGNIAGVAAPEAANNAASTGSMLPMITLGIPGFAHDGDSARRYDHMGTAPGATVVCQQPGFCLGINRVDVCRELRDGRVKSGAHSVVCSCIGNAVHDL